MTKFTDFIQTTAPAFGGAKDAALYLGNVAHHEAGHSLFVHLLGGRPGRVRVADLDRKDVGHTALGFEEVPSRERPGRRTPESLFRFCLVCMAGPVVERLPRGLHRSAMNDLGDMDEMTGAVSGLAMIFELFDCDSFEQRLKAVALVAEVLAEHKRVIQKLVEKLLDGPGTLSGFEVRAALRDVPVLGVDWFLRRLDLPRLPADWPP